MHSLKSCVKYSARKVSTFTTLNLTKPFPKVYHIKIDRAKTRNSFNTEFLKEIKLCFRDIHQKQFNCNAIVLSGDGQMFSSGLDFSEMKNLLAHTMDPKFNEDYEANYFALRDKIIDFQEVFNIVEKCQVPVIAAIHGGCFGAGMALAAVADVRYCTPRTHFQIREIELGFPSDSGLLQRLNRITGNDAFVREIALTGRAFNGTEAHKYGFALLAPPSPNAADQRGTDELDKETMVAHCIDLAHKISLLNPMAVRGTKLNLNHVSGGSAGGSLLANSLEYAATFNLTALRNPAMGKNMKELFTTKVS